MTTLLEVRQDSLLSLGDGNTPPQALLRMGVMPVATKWDLFALGGYMFTAKQTTIGTPLAGSAADNAGIVLTAPTFRFSVPVGTTVFPYRFNLAFATAAGVDNEIAVAYDDTNTYTSGGTAITPLNWRTDNPRATAVTNCVHAAGSAIVEASLTNPRVIYQSCIPLAFAFATSYKLEDTKVIEFPNLIPIVGPASFLIWVSAKTTASTSYMSVDWAEVPTKSAITAV
jgi:hypothetical protein